MRIEKAPTALGLIPDGNRRWARSHKMKFLNGYELGVKKFIDFAEWCKDYGVANISVWAFSTENFRRPGLERKALFDIYKRVASDREIISRLHSNETRFNIVGNRSLLPRDLNAVLRRVESETRRYGKRAINMLIAYGGRDDILHAATKVVNRAVRGGTGRISESMFRSYMFSARVPDIDMVIRTSGEERMSGFMPWQSTYSELYFSGKLWPDFTKRDLERALSVYESRQRRFGR